MPEKILSIAEAAGKLSVPFTHTVLGQVDDYCAYLSRFQGSYKFHDHAKDEMYLVLQGQIHIDYADGTSVPLGEGDTLVVKAHEVHRSRSEGGALVLMFKAAHLFAE
ncbi:MAG: cupin domain-containing protein [Anaerolineae bacterium]|nr:cupin domain-containing protein [Anaerolineae bacterium]